MRRLRHGILAFSLVVIAFSGQSTARADEASAEPVDPITESSVTMVSESQLDQELTSGDAPNNTATETAAVNDYLETAPDEGSYLAPEDLQVGTVDVGGGTTATVVAPESAADIHGVDIVVDSEANEITAAADIEYSDTEATTAGPGMGSWAKWEDSPSWAMQIRIYKSDNFIGKATFQTQRRRYNGADFDIWQIARSAVAVPDEYELTGPDADAYVKKLWISQQLTASAQNHAQAWRWDYTNPEASTKLCESSSGSISAGPFSFSPSNCEDYDVWTGDPGHQRFDYDQGFYAGGSSKSIAYVSGVQMDNGYTPYATVYQFLTLRLGGHEPQSGHDYKCTSELPGYESGTQTGSCKF